MNKTLRFVIIASPLGCYKAYLAAAAIWAVESALLDEFRTMRPFTSNLVYEASALWKIWLFIVPR
jgi:hypothetical protein